MVRLALVLFVQFALLCEGKFDKRCCFDSSGQAIPQCTCIVDNAELLNLGVAQGGTKFFHWRLSNFSLIQVPDSRRPNITFVAKPCAGSLEVYIRPVVGTEFPSKDNAWFKATRKKDANFIKLPLLYSEYFLTVKGETASNFTLLNSVDDALLPTPGYGGDVLLNQTEHYSVSVAWFSPLQYRGHISYTVYHIPYNDEAHSRHCNSSNTTSCFLSPILWTSCGLRSDPTAYKAVVEAVEVAGVSREHTFTFQNLPLEQPIFFNVVAKTDRGLTLAYRGATTSLQFDRVRSAIDEPLLWRIVDYLCIAFVSCVMATILSEALLDYSVAQDTKKRILATLAAKQSDETKSNYVPEDSEEREGFDSPRATGEVQKTSDGEEDDEALLDSLLIEAEEAFATPDGSPTRSEGDMIEDILSESSLSPQR